MPSRTAAILGLVALVLPAPVARVFAQDMSSLWPSDDGRSWTYQHRLEQFVLIPGVTDHVVRIWFDGETVAPNGIAAQALREELLAGPISTLAPAPGVTSPLLRNLWEARPDLRGAIAALAVTAAAGVSPCPEFAPAARALLLGGEFAYRKTSGEIAAWRCNRADTRSWIWLESDLTLGSTFTLQLVPDLADNVFLHGTIGGFEDVAVPGGTFGQCLRVDYVVDYGTSICTDERGVETGTFRSETRGSVYYAPGVGPVQSSEEFIHVAVVTGDCVPPGDVGRVSHRITRKLASGTVPAISTTWGRIKTIYR